MAPALDDILLVLLEQPHTAYDLRQRYVRVFGARRAVDLGRVLASTSRLERSGHVRTAPAALAPGARRHRPTFTLTPAGRHRQRTWLLDLTDSPDTEDIYVRGLLAVEVADPDTLQAFVGNGLAVVGSWGRQAPTTPDVTSPAVRARRSFDREIDRALVLWLHELARHR